MSQVPDGRAVESPSAPKPRRSWSARRAPAVLCALLGAAACAAVLYDVVSVRFGGTPSPWRHALLNHLYGMSVTDALAVVAAAVLVVVGLWLIFLAVTPGARKRAPMKPPGGDVRAFLDRSATALLLRDVALEVPGAGDAKIRVRRRKVRVRATVRFGDPTEVEAELTRALTSKRDGLGLARPPRLAIRVRPDGDWTPPVPEQAESAGSEDAPMTAGGKK
ncbi:DUF6286 domain-containing protein [Streptomyces montanisoli]|uniref:DUF6286 domain-containing protein n=1 Tax=Streptomyces montanisoli TaxID=2798581 RepID=A0A940M766_9ACTN|nr:DUF6286 domain-containing protein [Streptomyces montanisoli]MBP0457439.1 hypothetical protein [Streptomyces montanisoli]